MAEPLAEDQHTDRCLALRTHIETFAARHAAMAVHAGASTMSLHAAFGKVEQAIGRQDVGELARADERLHLAVVDLAGVPNLRDIWRIAWDGLRGFYDLSLHRHWPDLRSLLEEHEKLVDAILSGDPGMAEDAARNHLEAVRYRMAQRGEGEGAGADPLQRTTAYLAFHLHRPLRLTEIAERVAFTSPGNLSRLFRQRYGLGFQQYLQRTRIERAANLLRASCLPVRGVAARVGYADLSRFAQHFRRWFHTTPLRYRKGG